MIDGEMFWNKFGWIVIRYHYALEHLEWLQIARGKFNEGILYKEFDYLSAEMEKLFKKHDDPQQLCSSTITELLDQETSERNAEIDRVERAQGNGQSEVEVFAALV